jgi:hypothetical protein
MSNASVLIPPPQLKNVLRVEGPDDMGVLIAALQYLGAKKDKVEVKPSEGINKLLEAIPVDLKGSDLSNLGIVMDADSDAQARWDAIKQVLTKAGYITVPKSPVADGAIITQTDMPSIGVWIMPDNANGGAVEHFASLLVPAGDALWPLAEKTVQTVITTDRRFGMTHELKATMHTWLAWQKEPGRPMGQAITKHYLDPASTHAEPLYEWLKKLFRL